MITVIVRTLNEEHRIGQFCLAYTDANRILVADGGSTDDTVEIARRFHNVEVREFTERRELAHGHWRNPDSNHVNFLIKWSKEYESNFIILDDVDCRPNKDLKDNYREILEQTNKDFIHVTRIYMYGLDKHLPGMAQPVTLGKWEPSMWAWRSKLDFWTIDEFPHYSLRVGDNRIPYDGFDDQKLDLMPPYCLLHHSWDTIERVEKKLKHHREGLGIYMNHPLDMGSELADLEVWMKE